MINEPDKESPQPQPDWREMDADDIADQNESVNKYMERWEGRTLSAEARVQALEEALRDLVGALKCFARPPKSIIERAESLLTPKPANEAEINKDHV